MAASVQKSTCERNYLSFFFRRETKLSGRRARVQSDKALSLVLLVPGSGTEPEIDFPDHDQDAGDDEACVVARTYQ